jgi:hypothetical protein
MHTIDALLDFLLCRRTEDLSLPPNFHHSADLVLCVGWRAFVGCLRGLGEDRFEGSQELLLLAHLGCLSDFCGMYKLEFQDEYQIHLPFAR